MNFRSNRGAGAAGCVGSVAESERAEDGIPIHARVCLRPAESKCESRCRSAKSICEMPLKSRQLLVQIRQRRGSLGFIEPSPVDLGAVGGAEGRVVDTQRF